MEAKDLMIGDWVAFRGHPYQYTAQDIANMAECEAKGIPTDTTGIPLTEKILEYNLATEPQISWCLGWNRKDDIHIEIKREDINAAFYGVIAYVHQLQHALRLCGIDKEIKLED